MSGERRVSETLRFGMPCANILVAAFLFSPALAQNSPTAPAGADIKQTYAKLCGGCHGADARGTQQGPGLAGNPSVRRRSIQNLRNVIRNGIPSGRHAGIRSAGRHDRCSREPGCVAECIGCGEHRAWRPRCRQTVFLWQGTMRLLPHGLRRGRADRPRPIE